MKGFVAGFLKKDDGQWLRHWVEVNRPYVKRDQILDDAKAEIVKIFGVYCGGEAIARRKVIFVDAICPDGREILETFFEALRVGPPTESATEAETPRRED
jgi:hypothetical protein